MKAGAGLLACSLWAICMSKLRGRWLTTPWPVRARVVMTSVCLLAIVTASKAAAQQVAQPSIPLLNRASSDGYVLGVGDQVSVRVVDLEEYTDAPYRIDPDGRVDLPLIGQVQAAGDTLDIFKHELYRRLSRYVTSPKVTVNLITHPSSRISIVGEVTSPGVHELSGSTTLLEAISEAGGLKPDAGSTVLVSRVMENGKLPVEGERRDRNGQTSTATLSLNDLMNLKDPNDNFVLRPGDVVSIPKAAIVYVIGDVHRSGGFPIATRTPMTVLEALSLAEGLSTNNASRYAKILRPASNGDGKPTEIPVNVQAIFAGKAPDPPLFGNDILFIPHSVAEAGAKRAAEIVLQVATGVLIYR